LLAGFIGNPGGKKRGGGTKEAPKSIGSKGVVTPHCRRTTGGGGEGLFLPTKALGKKKKKRKKDDRYPAGWD